MAQLEYGDFYKFVASAGIALIAGAIAVPWLFLREPFDLGIETATLTKLTPIAQGAVTLRQEIVADLLPWVPWVSAVLAILGTILVICGLVLWYKRQRVRDRGEEAAVKKAEHDLEKMTPQEVEAKMRQELESIEAEPSPSEVVTIAPVPVSAVEAYVEAERALFARMQECLGPDVHAEFNRRISNIQYDAILRLGSNESVIVEVKYIRKGFNSGFLAESVNGLIARTTLYASRFSNPSRAVLIIILASRNRIFVEKIEQLKQRIVGDRPQLANIGIYCIEKDEIPILTCYRVRQMLGA